MGCMTEPGAENFLDPCASAKSTAETVLSVHYWTPTLISFRTTRALAFQFTPGHYTRLGLTTSDGDIVWRPISLVSAAHEDTLEFLVILIPGGEFSQAIAGLKTGNPIQVEKLSYGFLTADQLAAGSHLWLLASGSGLGPFVSILRDNAVWRNFERLIVVHSVRQAAELAYRDELSALAAHRETGTERAQLTYLPLVTRAPGTTVLTARVTELLGAGQLEAAAGTTLDAATSRVMVCGNPAMALQLRHALAARGFASSRRNAPGQMAFENYWHEQN